MELSSYLNNIHYILPEIFLALSLVSLLAYGVVYSKIEGKVGQLINITNLTILTMLIGIWLLSLIELNEEIIIGNLLGINKLSIGIKEIILLSGSLVLLWSQEVIKKKDEKLVDYEFSQLVLMSIIGMLLLISSRDLIMMYLSVETLSLSLYVLASIRRTGQYSTEAGLKYFILGAVSSGLLLFGSALVYILTGLTEWGSINEYIILSDNVGVKLGASLIIMALLFKLAAAPFHVWAPDVYEGSPTIVTSFFAIVPKIAILGVLISLIYGPFIGIFNSTIQPILILSGILSIVVGSITAINQTKIKRLLAYSAIAHIGWILLGLGVGSWLSLQASIIYIMLYIIMSINSFGFVLYYFRGYGNNYITELSGLSRKEPVLAMTFSLCLFSIAGIPPLAGFFSKYNILISLIDENFIIVSVFSVILSVIGTFYYIRIIQWIYFNNSSDYILKDMGDVSLGRKTLSLGQSIILGASLYIIVTYLLYPNPLLILSFDLLDNLLM